MQETRTYVLPSGIGMLLLCACIAGASAGAVLPHAPLNWLGAGRHDTQPIPLGTGMPAMAGASEQACAWMPMKSSPGEATHAWSERELADWKTQGKVTAPRILMAKLAAGQDVEAVNQYLQEAAPWSGVGSKWLLFKGDYDFTLVSLTTILYLFGNTPNLLYPETVRHLLDVLLTEEGDTPLVTVPFTFGLVLDTENHHLMTEGSRYLKNQWLHLYGTEAQRADPAYDNSANGLGDWLSEYLDLMIHEGVYEFNSDPYVGYTLQALLNLDAFPESPVLRRKARYLLDIMNLQYALGSLGLRSNPPFRRRYEKAESTELNDDPHAAYMHTWLRQSPQEVPAEWNYGRYSGHALLAELLPYRLPDDVAAWTLRKGTEYYVRFGRGPSACPELYSGGPGYLLSAGGANRGFRSHIVARPITLFLPDGATKIQDCIHIRGRGHWVSWNNTGVYNRFACANGPVHVPAHMKAAAVDGDWRIFAPEAPSRLLIAVYDDSQVGLIALFPETTRDPQALLAAIMETNPDPALLQNRFANPDGTVLEYEPDAPKGTWVLRSVNGREPERVYDTWPQFEGMIASLSFAR